MINASLVLRRLFERARKVELSDASFEALAQRFQSPQGSIDPTPGVEV